MMENRTVEQSPWQGIIAVRTDTKVCNKACRRVIGLGMLWQRQQGGAGMLHCACPGRLMSSVCVIKNLSKLRGGVSPGTWAHAQ